jgi:hypothetical protein
MSDRIKEGSPVAWAAVGKNGVPMWLAYHRQDAEGAVVGMAEVVPLYRSPTLTDEGREAIEAAIDYLEASSSPVQNRRADTLRGLLEKTGREHAGE